MKDIITKNTDDINYNCQLQNLCWSCGRRKIFLIDNSNHRVQECRNQSGITRKKSEIISNSEDMNQQQRRRYNSRSCTKNMIPITKMLDPILLIHYHHHHHLIGRYRQKILATLVIMMWITHHYHF